MWGGGRYSYTKRNQPNFENISSYSLPPSSRSRLISGPSAERTPAEGDQ